MPGAHTDNPESWFIQAAEILPKNLLALTFAVLSGSQCYGDYYER